MSSRREDFDATDRPATPVSRNEPHHDARFVVRVNDRYYRDTRGESGYGGCSDIFTSSTLVSIATRYGSYEEANKWATEFLQGNPFTVEEIIGAVPTAPAQDTRTQEGSRIHDGEVPYLAGCPRSRTDCSAISRVASPDYASFMCCGETDSAPVPTDVLRLCIKSSHDRKPVDILVNLDRRDAIDVSSVLLGGMSSLAQVDAAHAFAISEGT